MVLTVESCPAISSSIALAAASLGVIGPSGPSLSFTSLDSTLSCGSVRNPWIRSAMYAVSAAVLSLPFCARARPSSVAASGPMSAPAMKSKIQPWKVGSSFNGTPRIWQMTATGTG